MGLRFRGLRYSVFVFDTTVNAVPVRFLFVPTESSFVWKRLAMVETFRFICVTGEQDIMQMKRKMFKREFSFTFKRKTLILVE